MGNQKINGDIIITGSVGNGIDSISTTDLINGATSFKETTWAELKILRDNGELIPGRLYRITDYVCSTSQENTSSAGHQFDIIVRADTEGSLNEDAFAANHISEESAYIDYFADSNLSAWKLKYCLDNDISRFIWADTADGKGIIYYLKDEFGNEAPYDFKNILFTIPDKYSNVYTFNYFDSSSETNLDATILAAVSVSNNIVKEYHLPSGAQGLNFNVFTGDCKNNTLGKDCAYITFLQSNCSYNIFDDGCSYIDFTCDDSDISRGDIRNAHVHLGTSGEDPEAILTISVPSRNQKYEIAYKAYNSADIIFTEPIELANFNITSIDGSPSSLTTIIVNRF